MHLTAWYHNADPTDIVIKYKLMTLYYDAVLLFDNLKSDINYVCRITVLTCMAV